MNSTSHTGAVGEMSVSVFFLQHGLEVFNNVATRGPVDLIVYNKDNGKMVPIDVKSHTSVTYRKDGGISPTYIPFWREDGVAIVKYIHGETSPRLPEGFWEALGMEGSDEHS